MRRVATQKLVVLIKLIRLRSADTGAQSQRRR
jgi:hypothetical protein